MAFMDQKQFNLGRICFEHVRDIPYRVPESPQDPGSECTYKSELLVRELTDLGFNVRLRIAEMDWAETLMPREIAATHPKNILATHYFVEIEREGKWWALDASWDRGLEKAGFPIADFDGKNSPAFPLIRIFTSEEQAAHLKLWSDQAYIEAAFKDYAPFLKAANAWLAKVRMEIT